MNTSRPRGISALQPTARWVVYATVTVAISVSAYNFGRASTSSAKSEGAAPGRVSVPADEERLAKLEREVRRLRQVEVQVDRLQAHQSESERMAARAAVDAVEPSPAEAQLSPAERAAKAREEEAAFHSDLDARLAAETVDPRWRKETEAAIAQVFPEQFGPGVELGEVECASSLCKVVLNHADSPRIRGDKFTSLLLNRGALGGFALQADNSREGSTTLYLMYGQTAPADEEVVE